MKRVISLALGVLVLTGCVGSRITPTADTLAAFRALTVVPVETMPLWIRPNGRAEAKALAAFMRTATPLILPAEPAGRSDQPALASLAQTAAPMTAAPSLAVRTGASAVALVGGLVVIAELIEAGQEVPGAVPSIEPRQAEPRWMPSVAFARRAAASLDRPGGPAVHLLDAYYRLPVADRRLTWHRENWLKPIRRWHQADTSPLDYRGQGLSPGTAILEVGVADWEITSGVAVVSVLMKLVDGSTNQVVGRSYRVEVLWNVDLVPLLEQEGRPLRELIETTGVQLTNQCLTDLGLISKVK